MTKTTRSTRTAASDAMKITMIPLSRLRRSDKNVRTVGGKDVSALAASILARGVLQNLNVTKHGEHFDVVSGGRRLLAMQKLCKSKKIDRDFLVPCRIEDEANAIATSLTENIERENMHPADQFAAFQRLIEEGKSVDDIAAEFGLAKLVVTQRLKLATVAPSLMDLFRDGKVGIECMMAYAMLDDHGEQERIFTSLPKYQRTEASYVRQCITGGDIKPSAPLARYVGVEAYEAAGGKRRGDLFSNQDDAGLIDRALLTELAVAKLEKTAKRVGKEGWGWVDTYPEVNSAAAQACRRMPAVLRAATAEESEELRTIRDALADLEKREDALQDESDVQEEAWEEACNAIQEERAKLEARHDEIDLARRQDDSAIRKHAGVIISLDHSGSVKIERGLVRSADWKTVTAIAQPETHAESGQTGDGSSQPQPGDEAEQAGVSDALCRSLTAERTLAMRAVFAARPETALVAVVHSLILSTFFHAGNESALNLFVIDKSRLHGAAPHAVEASLAAASLSERKEALASGLPAKPALWEWLFKQPTETLLAYMAFCVSEGVDAVIESTKQQHTWGGRSFAASHDLAAALDLNMAEWWSARSENYLGRVKKDLLVEAVTEATGADAAAPLAKMKKGEAVIASESALSGTGWLPALLRRPG